jgi:ribonucleotide monophosphatase NagD (HAD superfamily)
MIGDNPEGDIEGANRKGWVSILVRTGLFQGDGNHPVH